MPCQSRHQGPEKISQCREEREAAHHVRSPLGHPPDQRLCANPAGKVEEADEHLHPKHATDRGNQRVGHHQHARQNGDDHCHAPCPKTVHDGTCLNRKQHRQQGTGGNRHADPESARTKIQSPERHDQRHHRNLAEAKKACRKNGGASASGYRREGWRICDCVGPEVCVPGCGAI